MKGKDHSKRRKGLLTQDVRENIAKATRMIAEGKPVATVAAELGVTERAMEYWRQKHRKVWNRDFRLAVQAVVSKVRKDAGTDRVMADPDEYMRLATLADKWTAEQDIDLYPQDAVDLSLMGFYRAYYLRNCIGNVLDETKRQYEMALNLWRRITGDPPLRLVTNSIVAKFRDTMLKMSGRGGRPYSPNTARSKMTMIQAILDAAGPAGPRRRDAAGILAKVPYAKPPREELDVPRVVSMEWLAAIYKAAAAMNCPCEYGIKPVDWWRALLSVTLNTALRRGTLFALRWEFVDFAVKQIILPTTVMKARKRLSELLAELETAAE